MYYKTYVIITVMLFFLMGCANQNDDNQYTGILEGTSVKVPALTGGQITNLLVDTGDEVQRGQTLAHIDSLELFYQRQQLLAIKDELNAQKNIAKTDLKRTEKDLNYIETKYHRINQLYQKQSATKQNRDDVENQLNNLKAAHLAAKQKLISIAAKMKQIEAQLNSLNKKLKDATIKSPISGTVTNTFFEAGEAVPPLSPVIEVMNISKLETKIYISETLLPMIKHGQGVDIRVDGLDEELSGDIIWVSPKAEFTPKTILTPETRTSLVYAVKVAIENQNGILKDGMPVVVKLPME
jgi:HlyD family secretion protein